MAHLALLGAGPSGPDAALDPLPPYLTGLLIAVAPWYGWYTDDGVTLAGNGEAVKRCANGAPGQAANFLAQATAGARPTRSNGTGPNGLDELVSDGGDYLLSQLNMSGSGVHVFSLAAIATGVKLFIDTANASAAANAGFFVSHNGASSLWMEILTTSGEFDAITKTGSYSSQAYKTIEMGYQSNDSRFCINGVSQAPLTQSGSDAYINRAVTCAMFAARDGSFAGSHRAVILLVYDHRVDDTNANAVHAWLNAWGKLY